jgi:aspartyl-tRNA synthetase
MPQSPQLFKQLLMVAGMDRYFQVVRCFRDEDLRADRQPEFTQLDLEMSFAGEEDVREVTERIVVDLFRETIGIEPERPFPLMTYADAMLRYGTDKPDLRFGLELVDVTEGVRGCGFGVFTRTVEGGGVVRGLRVPGAASFSRKDIDGLTAVVAEYGARGAGLAQGRGAGALVVREVPRGGGEGPPARGHGGGGGRPAPLRRRQGEDRGRGARRPAARARAATRPDPGGGVPAPLGRRLPASRVERGRGAVGRAAPPVHRPHPEDLELLATDPGRVRAVAYDLVLNGSEAAGGSVRIHRSDVQQQVFRVLGIEEEEAREKFGFLLDAFRYGAPPHAGIAFGFDRIVSELAGFSSIREVIAFPKTTSAACLLTGAPSAVSPDQLEELRLRVVESEDRG